MCFLQKMETGPINTIYSLLKKIEWRLWVKLVRCGKTTVKRMQTHQKTGKKKDFPISVNEHARELNVKIQRKR